MKIRQTPPSLAIPSLEIPPYHQGPRGLSATPVPRKPSKPLPLVETRLSDDRTHDPGLLICPRYSRRRSTFPIRRGAWKVAYAGGYMRCADRVCAPQPRVGWVGGDTGGWRGQISG